MKWVNKGVYIRGVNKGKSKWEQVYVDGGVKDVMEISKQLSYYRYLMRQKAYKLIIFLFKCLSEVV